MLGKPVYPSTRAAGDGMTMEMVNCPNCFRACIRSLPEDNQEQFTIRRSPRLEIEFDGDGGGHFIRAIAADGKSALGSAPKLVLMDKRGHWQADQRNALEHALLSGLGKLGGRALIISTSAADDAHPFSMWLDEDTPGVYRQEHRPSGHYGEMQDCDELATLGDQTVPIVPSLVEIIAHVKGEAVTAIATDRYQQAELGVALNSAGIRCPIVAGVNYFTWGGATIQSPVTNVPMNKNECIRAGC